MLIFINKKLENKKLNRNNVYWFTINEMNTILK